MFVPIGDGQVDRTQIEFAAAKGFGRPVTGRKALLVMQLRQWGEARTV